MKKFVVIENIGTWEKKDGKKIINCTVKEKKIIAEAETAQELVPLAPLKTDYRADGTWHSYSIESRKWARRMGFR